MKKISCLDCDQEFLAETEQGALKQMHPHYMEMHRDVMKSGTDEDRNAWFDQFRKNWITAPKISDQQSNQVTV